MTDELAAAVAGIVAGTFTRWYLLRVDYRNYPSYPHGYVSHLALGVVASFLGAVAVPALVAREYTAVTFLALAAQQFREVRDLVRTSLTAVESLELVKRGPDYIEGIARVFEARNYLVMMVAVVTGGGWIAGGPWLGVPLFIVGAVVAALSMRGRQVGDIADVRTGRVEFQGPGLYVDGIFIMNVGLPEQRRDLLKHGRGVVVAPGSLQARYILASAGQRQALLHDASAAAGVLKDIAEPEFTPLARRALDDGRIALFLVPIRPDTGPLLAAVARVPVLEAAMGAGPDRARR